MLRNPAYCGKACYGKTALRPRQRITRPLRQRNGVASRDSANHERPRQEWIEVPVPPLVSEEVFALAQEQLQKNRHHSPRRTMEPTLLQGMLVCQQCGYALYRASTRTSKQKINYYRCIGSDGYRRLKGPVCTNRPLRQDSLDQFVWDEMIRLLDDPALVQAEIDRRREAARQANPLRKREEELRREQARLEKSIERLINAYQEGLVTLSQLRHRMPELRRQIQAVESELRSLEMAALDEARYLQLADTLATFRGKLRTRAETLDVRERQQIVRLLVKEILVDSATRFASPAYRFQAMFDLFPRHAIVRATARAADQLCVCHVGAVHDRRVHCATRTGFRGRRSLEESVSALACGPRSGRINVRVARTRPSGTWITFPQRRFRDRGAASWQTDERTAMPFSLAY
jgi:site-specific DNA recombinase